MTLRYTCDWYSTDKNIYQIGLKGVRESLAHAFHSDIVISVQNHVWCFVLKLNGFVSSSKHNTVLCPRTCPYFFWILQFPAKLSCLEVVNVQITFHTNCYWRLNFVALYCLFLIVTHIYKRESPIHSGTENTTTLISFNSQC